MTPRSGRRIAGPALPVLGVLLGTLAFAPPAEAIAQEAVAPEAPEAASDTTTLAPLDVRVRRTMLDPGLARSVEEWRADRADRLSLTGWLGALGGVSLRSRGYGGRQVLSIRGSRPEGVLVLLDGLPLNDPVSGVADLSIIGPASVDRAVLVRGASAARFGDGALAGALVLETGGWRDGPSGVATLGSFGRRELSVAGGGSAGAAEISARAGLSSSRNDFRYRNRLLPGGPTVERKGADRERRTLSLAGRWAATRTVLRVDDLERGIPGRLGTTVFEGDRYAERRVGVSTVGRWAGITSTAAVRRMTMAYRPEDGPSSIHRATDARLSGELEVGRDVPLVLSAHASLEHLSGDDLERSPLRMAAGIRARSDARLSHGKIGFEPGLSLDAARGEVAVSPEFGAWWIPDPPVRLFARLGRSFRQPTFADLYLESAPGLRANPDLQPERVVFDGEVGGQLRLDGTGPRLGVRASAWRRVTTRPIVWLASSSSIWSPRNLDRLVAVGVDLDAEIRVTSALSLASGLSLQRSRLGFGSNRNPMPYQPDARATAVARLDLDRMRLALSADYIGSRTTTLAATRRLPAALRWETWLSRRFTAGGVSIEATATIHNLTDVRFEFVELFPEPGRHVSLTMRIDSAQPQEAPE